MDHRQAYAPAPLPLIASVLVVSMPLAFVSADWTLGTAWHPWLNIAVGVLVGGGVTRLWWWRWRRRHPVLSAEEWRRVRADAAPFN
jgi:hypothetical protein